MNRAETAQTRMRYPAEGADKTIGADCGSRHVACAWEGRPERADEKKAPEILRSFFLAVSGGVANGTRTHDNQNHNLGLYQLSYSHHRNQRL